MKLPDAVIDKLQDGESPVTHAAIIEGGEMIIRYTCDGKVIGQTMFHYTPENIRGLVPFNDEGDESRNRRQHEEK
jgi:hypothetical protein